MPSAPEPKRDLHRLLRDLPERTAPSSLEARVLSELARRARLPWWRRSYAEWPPVARMSFFALSALAAAALIAATARVVAVPTAGAASVARAWAPWAALASSIAAAAEDLATHIPTAWIYGGACFLAACLATVFTSVAIAIRMIRRPRVETFPS